MTILSAQPLSAFPPAIRRLCYMLVLTLTSPLLCAQDATGVEGVRVTERELSETVPLTGSVPPGAWPDSVRSG